MNEAGVPAALQDKMQNRKCGGQLAGLSTE